MVFHLVVNQIFEWYIMFVYNVFSKGQVRISHRGGRGVTLNEVLKFDSHQHKSLGFLSLKKKHENESWCI